MLRSIHPEVMIALSEAHASRKALAEELGVTPHILRDKLSGKTSVTHKEACIIRNAIAPERDLYTLFQKWEPKKKTAAKERKPEQVAMGAFLSVIRSSLLRLGNLRQPRAEKTEAKQNASPSLSESIWISVPDDYVPRDGEEIEEFRSLIDEKPKRYLVRNKAQD